MAVTDVGVAGGSEVMLVNERHCRRSIAAYRFADFVDARAAMIAGGQLQELNLTLRHPETMICDLSNLDLPIAGWSKASIKEAFLAIEAGLKARSPAPSLRRITGDDLRPEIALSGPSRRELEVWRRDFLSEILAGIGTAAPTGEPLRGLQKSRPLTDAPEQVHRFLREFNLHYSQFVHPAYWAEHPALNVQRLYCDHPVWKAIAALSGRKLFVLSAGLSLGLSYMSSTDDREVYFTEHHGQNDAHQLARVSRFSGVYPDPPAASEWVVVDKSYSGGTIDAAAATLEAQFGRKLSIIKVALFPKSLQAIHRSDYAVYAGRLFRCRDVLPLLSEENWHFDLLRAS